MSNPTQPSKSGGSSWLIVLLVVLLLLVLTCGGLCGGCIYLGKQAAVQVGKTAAEFGAFVTLVPAYAATQQAVDNDPQVIDRLGQPITTLAMPTRQNSGEMKPQGETFQYDIRGPNGTAIVSGVATADGGAWRVSTITVTFSDGSLVTVPAPADQPRDGKFQAENGEIQLPPDLNEPIETK